jgi:hypothetical protein
MRALVFLCAVALVTAAGCLLDSQAITVPYTLQPDSLASATNQPPTAVPVDLNTVSQYSQRKGSIRGLADLAILGRFRNNALTVTRVEWWVARDGAVYTTPAQVRTNCVMLWGGPEMLPRSSMSIDWNKSAGLTHTEGVDAVFQELQGDGKFTLYAIGALNGTNYNFTVLDASLVLIVNSGS